MAEPVERPAWVQAEIDGMHRQKVTGAESFAALLEPPHPVEVSRVAGVMIGPLSRKTAYMAAYLLRDAGLLPGDDGGVTG